MASIFLLSCSKTKRERRLPAKDIYASPLFHKARAYAEKVADRFYILSAKHGLVTPDTVIAPYDDTLRSKTVAERKEWAQKVLTKLKPLLLPGDKITILAGRAYREFLLDELRSVGCVIDTPLAGMSIGQQLKYLGKINQPSKFEIDLSQFYLQLDRLEFGLAGGRLLRECTGRLQWPTRGVYFLFEPDEFRPNEELKRRVVRVGTHAVSKRSTSTLWNRLSTHRGTADGRGSHRSSILRLHIGMALMERSKGEIVIPTWSQGQHAPRDVLNMEEGLEREVSKYIGQMSVLWLAVPDQAGKTSDRAFIERNAIALLSRCAHQSNPASRTWLGNFSPRRRIRNSALWNLNHVDEPYDDRFLEVFAEYVDVTIGQRASPTGSLAPSNWHISSERDQDQLSFFS
ncbi:MAG: hypothetical protein MN733_11775 [Nitrososphaera sp.]|nr:hypothetical protein [Nitrososphaera sp.]